VSGDPQTLSIGLKPNPQYAFLPQAEGRFFRFSGPGGDRILTVMRSSREGIPPFGFPRRIADITTYVCPANFHSPCEGVMSMPSRDEIFEKVQAALVDALGVDDDEVTPEATMVGDLGAESIDFLDIVFRLEKAFGIKIPRGELFPEDVLSSTDYVVNGKLNEAGLAALKERMPFVDLTKFEENPSVQNFPNTLTVEDMVRYVQSKLAG
jgi:acyl carrier protein